MHMEFIMSSLRIVVLTELTDSGAVERRMSGLVGLEEYCFVTEFHQQV
jgi:hypothetical protein